MNAGAASGPIEGRRREPCLVVVMGVAGCGKSTVGQALAQDLVAPFLEGDTLHPAANIAKMSAGIPLDDDDRAPWLDALGQAAGAAARAAPGGISVAACSALKRAYRDRLRRAAAMPLRIVCLHGERDLLQQRLGARQGHFMPPSLLESQLRTLELPGRDEDALLLDVALPPQALVGEAIAWVRGAHPRPARRA